MIKNFKHKGLKRLYEDGNRSGLSAEHVGKIKLILSALEAADTPEEMDLPVFRLHPLLGDKKGYFSVTLRANWRITFRFDQGKMCDVDLEDYH